MLDGEVEDISVADLDVTSLLARSAVLVASSEQLSLSSTLHWLPVAVLVPSARLKSVLTVRASVAPEDPRLAAASTLPLAALVVAVPGGCGRCSRPGGTDAKPLYVQQTKQMRDNEHQLYVPIGVRYVNSTGILEVSA